MHALMGDMATAVLGDFLQLPPVEDPSLAKPIDAEGFDDEVEFDTPTPKSRPSARQRASAKPIRQELEEQQQKKNVANSSIGLDTAYGGKIFRQSPSWNSICVRKVLLPTFFLK